MSLGCFSQMHENEYIFVFEGEKTAITMHGLHGVNAIATCGSGKLKNALNYLHDNGYNKVIVCPDKGYANDWLAQKMNSKIPLATVWRGLENCHLERNADLFDAYIEDVFEVTKDFERLVQTVKVKFEPFEMLAFYDPNTPQKQALY
jgi:5S rRNA maturation endonuclease (ribonuclease M5)